MKEIFSFFWETFKIVVVAFLIVVPIRYFLFQPFIVRGDSMLPSFENGDYLLIDELSFRLREPRRGEVIVFRPPDQPTNRYIKRIIGLPGETIEISDGQVLIGINSSEKQVLDESNYFPEGMFTPGNLLVSLKENEYFVLGDNRSFSLDSRRFGVLSKENMIGRVFFRAWPIGTASVIAAPDY